MLTTDQRDIRKKLPSSRVASIEDVDRRRLRTAVERLKKLTDSSFQSSIHVIFVQDLPIPCLNLILSDEINSKHEYTRQVFLKGLTSSCEYPVSLHNETNKPIDTIYLSLAKANEDKSKSKVIFESFSPELCPGGLCKVELERWPIHGDLSPHLEIRSSFLLTEKWKILLKSLIAKHD